MSIELINTDCDNVMDYESKFNDCLVDLSKEVESPDVICYYGYDDRGKRVPLLTRGEFSAIVAQSKTKKSYNKSLIEGACFGGTSDNYTDHIKGNLNNNGYIISIDTEQGDYYAQKTFKRPERISGHRYNKYKPLSLRKTSIQERLELIDWLVFESKYAGKIDLLMIDGIADLVYNTNDIEEGVKVGEKLLKWTSEGKLHACIIIHKNGSSDKARGHLGTAVQIKAEAIILMDAMKDEKGNFIINKDGEQEKNTVKIRCGMSRGRGFNDFYLRVDKDGLPFTFDDPDNPVHPKQIFEEEKPVHTATPLEAFGEVDNPDEVPF